MSGAIPPPCLSIERYEFARAFLGRKDMPPETSVFGGIFVTGPFILQFGTEC